VCTDFVSLITSHNRMPFIKMYKPSFNIKSIKLNSEFLKFTHPSHVACDKSVSENRERIFNDTYSCRMWNFAFAFLLTGTCNFCLSIPYRPIRTKSLTYQMYPCIGSKIYYAKVVAPSEKTVNFVSFSIIVLRELEQGVLFLVISG
jgi:hypothetical protein